MFSALDFEQLAVFLILALIAEIIGTVSGFGSSILFVPLAALFFDMTSVLAITAVFHVFSNISKIFLFRKGVDKNILIRLGIPAILFVILGAWMTTFIPIQRMELIMNVTLAIVAVFMIVNFNKTIPQSNRNLYIGGIASGLLAGLVGSGGGIRGLTMAAFHLPKDIFIATSAAIDLGVDVSRSIVYVGNGYFQQQHLMLLPFLLLISIFGSYIGKQILAYTSEVLFRYIVLILIILTAVLQLAQTFF